MQGSELARVMEKKINSCGKGIDTKAIGVKYNMREINNMIWFETDTDAFG